MPVTQSLNSKANVKKFTNQDLPFNPAQPVMSSYYATSTAGQTVINLSFSVDQTLTDQFFLFVDGKKLRLGSGNDYVFTSIGSDNRSSQVTLNQALAINLNIQAYQLGLKNEVEFVTDNRFTQLYEAQGNGFQGFVNQNQFMNATSTAGSPAPGTFYSSIVGRAAIVDLSQDLKARMGVDRIMTQQMYQVQNELGPNNELIWSTPNDLFGQIRFVGNWVSLIDTYGQRVSSNLNTDYIEVTFYGTGINLLQLVDSGIARDIRISVDGGSEGANVFPSSSSTLLGNRNYSPNQVLPLVSGLTLGVHTVKIRSNLTATYNIHCYGFEILNESTTLKVNPGVSYIQGKKYSTGSQQSPAYSASVTGSRGGRVVVYQNGNGTIGTAFQAVNASSATTTSADHTNEEVVRVYSPLEFGANRSDDFSSVSASNAARAFTLDDGTATLTASSSTFLTASSGYILSSTNGSFGTFTFVGTGLDIEVANEANGGADTYNFQVDGGATVPWQLTTGSTTKKILKIVSGLPYGTHTVRFNRVTAATYNQVFFKFIVYQPKKPSIPSGAVELADYNVMADYVANSTAGLSTLGTGVLRKLATREFIYVNGTGGTGDWSVASIDVVNHIKGFGITTDRLNAYWQYSFFGTGLEYRFYGNNASNILITVNGLTLNTTNFPAATFATYGTGVTFNSSTGILNLGNSGTPGCGFSVKGLPLAFNTVKANNGTAGQVFSIDTLDIITPIHSAKSNLYSDLQNTLSIGSQSISDNRKTTPVKDVLPNQKPWVQAVGVTSAPSTTSTLAVPCPDMSLTIKTSGGPLEIFYRLDTTGNVANDATLAQVYINGVAVGVASAVTKPTIAGSAINSDSFIVPVSAGTHKIDLYWWTTANTLTAGSNRRIIKAREL